MRMGRGAGASVGGGGLGRHSGLTVCNLIYQQVHCGPLPTLTVAPKGRIACACRAARARCTRASTYDAARLRAMPRRRAGQVAGSTAFSFSRLSRHRTSRGTVTPRSSR